MSGKQSLGQAVWQEQGPQAWDEYMGWVRKKEECKGQSWSKEDFPTGRGRGKARESSSGAKGQEQSKRACCCLPQLQPWVRSWGCLCLSRGHWRWCWLSDLPCPSWRGERGSALWKPGPDHFHCTVESKFAVISAQVIKLNVNPCWSSWKLRRTTHRAGRVRVRMGICYGWPVIAYAFVFKMNTSAIDIACWDLGTWSYKDPWNLWRIASGRSVTLA